MKLLVRLFCLVVFALLPSVLSAQGDTWETLNPGTIPPARMDHAMVALEDSTILMFGGKDALGNCFNDLYRFQDDDWVLLQATGDIPSARFGHVMVALPWEFEILVFGGEDENGILLNDMHSYSLATNAWTQIVYANDPPTARRDGVFWYSAYAGALFIQGGHDGASDITDFWRYSPISSQWDQLVDAPGPATGGTAFPAYNRVYVFDGISQSIDKYDLDTRTWESFQSVGNAPAARKYGAMASSINRAWLFGGEGSVLGDTWETFKYAELYTTRDSWTPNADMPEPLSHAAAALIPGRIILFGGEKADGTASDATYSYTPPHSRSVVLVVTPETATAKVGDAVVLTARAYDDAGNQIALIDPVWSVENGGIILPNGAECTFMATHLDNFPITCRVADPLFEETSHVSVIPARGDVLEEVFPPESPAARAGHSMVARNDTIFLFGGEGGDAGGSLMKPSGAIFGDLWRFTGAQASWEWDNARSTPPPRAGHVAWVSGFHMYVYGGRDENGNHLVDIYEMVNADWEHVHTYGEGPPGRSDAYGCTTPSGDLIMGGGIGDDVIHQDVWLWNVDTKQWEKKRDWPFYYAPDGMSLIPADNIMYMFGFGGTHYYYNATTDDWHTMNVPSPSISGTQYSASTTTGDNSHIIGGLQKPPGGQSAKRSANGTGIDFRVGTPTADIWWVNLDHDPIYMGMVESKLPEPLFDLKAAAFDPDAAIPQIVIFGGERADGTYSGRTFIYTPPYELALASIDVTPDEVTIGVGETVRFTALGLDADQEPVSLVPIWSSSGGQMDDAGLFSSSTEGTFIVTAAYAGGTITGTASVTVSTTGVEDGGGIPTKFALSQNYPNPFNPTTTIAFAVKEKCRVDLRVFDVLGREVRKLIDEDFEPGFHEIEFDAHRLATGIYIYRIRMGGFADEKRMLILE